MHVFPQDARLPELPMAVDPSIMGVLLASHLWPAGRMEVEDCQVGRIRYRPGHRCVIQYILTVRDPLTGDHHREWVTAHLFGEKGRAHRHASRSLAQDGVLGGPPWTAFIPDMRMFVRRFPHDPALPHAAALLTTRDAALVSAMLGTLGGGPWHIRDWYAEPVRYREHHSIVIRYIVTAARTDIAETVTDLFYVRAYARGTAAQRAWDDAQQLARYAAAESLPVRIDPPVAHLRHLDAVLFQGTRGVPLDRVLRDAALAEWTTVVRAAARATAAFNLSAAPLRCSLTRDVYARKLARSVALLEHACPDLTSALRVVSDVVRLTTHDTPMHPTHGDLKPEHVLVDRTGVALIDTTTAVSTDPVLDAAMMMARLNEGASDVIPPERLRAAAQAFDEEYFACVPEKWRRRLPPYRAGSLIGVAAGVFERQERNWPTRVRSLVMDAAARV